MSWIESNQKGRQRDDVVTSQITNKQSQKIEGCNKNHDFSIKGRRIIIIKIIKTFFSLD